MISFLALFIYHRLCGLTEVYRPIKKQNRDFQDFMEIMEPFYLIVRNKKEISIFT